MTVPAYTVYSNHPRLFFRDTEKATLQTRIANAAGWKTTWDSIVVPQATTYKGYSAATLVVTSDPHQRLMVLSMVGYLTETGRPANGYKDKAILGAVYLAGVPDDQQPTNYRNRVLGLAIPLDILYDDMTTTERNTISAELLIQCDRCTAGTQRMDGIGGLDQMCQMAGALAGFGHGSYNWQSRLTEAMQFFYGVGEDTNGGHIHFARYTHSDGGSWKGAYYTGLDDWGVLWNILFMTKATNVDAITAEAYWCNKVWEWMVWAEYTGGTDKDIEAQTDTSRTSTPKFQWELRWMLSNLIGFYPTTEGSKALAWLYNTCNAQGTPSANDIVFDIVFWDKAAVTATAPKSLAAPPAHKRLFQPPGIFYYRKAATAGTTWEYDDDVVFRMKCRKWYELNHRHLSSGATQIRWKGDRLLLAPAGFYDDYGSAHHDNAYQRSWLQSLVPLIQDTSQVYQRYSVTLAWDGGQQYKKWNGTSDADNIWNVVNDAGGLAWLRTESSSIVQDSVAGTFFVASFAEAYRKTYTDTQWVTGCKSKVICIPPSVANGLTYPAFLVYIRVSKANPTLPVIIPLHAPAAITTTAYGAYWLGYHGEGKLWVDLRTVGDYTLTNVPIGTIDANGWGSTQFVIPGTSDNYKPTKAATSRHWPDIKQSSLYVAKAAPSATEDYVFLFMPTAAGDTIPARTWVTDGAEPNYYGITLGTETYLIHRSQDLAVFGSPDTTPPAEVTSLAVAARDKALLATWTDPADADFSHVHVYYRTSAI